MTAPLRPSRHDPTKHETLVFTGSAEAHDERDVVFSPSSCNLLY